MGCRASICIKEENGNKIYFYTHHTGYRIYEDLQNALIRGKSRWNDGPFLARIIFSEIIKDDETGFGISTYFIESDGYVIYIDMKEKTVNTGGGAISFEEYINEELYVEM